MEDGYELSEDAVRRIAAAVRRVEAMGPPTPGSAGRQRHVQYKPAFYRLAAAVGDGEYTARAQAWNADDAALADVADAHHAEYDRDITVYDFRGRDGAAAGAAGTGAIVHGWKVWVNDDWITLVDVGPEPMFAVYAEKDGGVAGDASTTCTWTYSVYNLDQSTLVKKNAAGDDATGMTPEKSRLVETKYTTPSGKNLALACRLPNGDLVLWDANEVPYPPEAC